MTQVAIAWAGVLAALAVVELMIALAFVWRLRRPSAPPPERWPKFSILMSLRGDDPHLREAIRSALAQDYPNFEMRIVVDSVDDPAWLIVNEMIDELDADNVYLSLLRERRPHCSLLCSALVQTIDELDESTELITFHAADMIVPPNWLREMAAAMADPKVGGTLGNRWYMPSDHRWGSQVRYLWNAGAMVPMWLHSIPWGGAVALRLGDIRRSNLLERMSTGLVEDAQFMPALAELGLKMKFVPQLIAVNREAINLPCSYRFIRRQLLWTRLYHPGWAAVFVGSFVGGLAMLGPFVLAVAALVLGNFEAAAWAAAAGVGYLVAVAGLLGILDSGIRHVVRSRGEAVTPLSPLFLLRLAVAIPFTAMLYLASMVGAARMRSVQWRGIEYTFTGPNDVRMLEYHPFHHAGAGRELANRSVES